MHIPIIEKAGFEADDLIGTLAKQAEKRAFRFYGYSPIKILGNLFLKTSLCIDQQEWEMTLKFGVLKK